MEKEKKRTYGFGSERLSLPFGAAIREREERNRAMLARALNLRTLVAFVGSGCSAGMGYGDWNRLCAATLKITRDIVKAATTRNASVEKRLERSLSRSRRGDRFNGREMLQIMASCQKTVAAISDAAEAEWRWEIAQSFRLKQPSRIPKPNPYQHLLDLRITRFITTNYDGEIERAYGLGRGPISFTQKPEYHGDLALFALTRPREDDILVFHCHGRYDDPSSLVLTEADYQKWYLDRGDASVAFQESIELLFASNPILFVGFGMQDEDLMRLPRIISAVDPDRKESRPLFALMARTGNRDEEAYFEYLFERYGINVIGYDDDPARNARARSARMCAALTTLKEDWSTLRDQWWQKPAIRKVVVTRHPPREYRHYGLEPGTDALLSPERLKREQENLIELVRKSNPGIVVIEGSGGKGKSWRALRLLDWVARDPSLGIAGRFFWSSYYSNDWLTGLDRALKYFERDDVQTAKRADRFREHVRKRHLLVFDGFERLLRETDTPNRGRIYSRVLERLLKHVLTDDDVQTTIVLTTRLRPTLFDEIDRPERLHYFKVDRLTTDDLLNSKTFARLVAKKRIDEDEVSALCALLDGHAYALLLAAKYIETNDAASLHRALANTPPDRRLSHMIEELLMFLDRTATPRGAVMKLLNRLAIFMSPVTPETREVCLTQALGDVSEATRDRLVRKLEKNRILFRLKSTGNEESEDYTVHPTVRSYVFDRGRRGDGGVLPNFALAGFTSGTAAVYPATPEKADIVLDMFDSLVQRSRALYRTDRSAARQLARSAFGVLRSRTEANTTTRWTNYGKAIELGVRMMFLAKELSPDQWDYLERHHAQSKESKDGLLYADELSWLYNDLGLALCGEGSMADTYGVWEQGYAINRVTDSEEDGGQYIVQSRLHMAHTFLELGRLNFARDYLIDTRRSNETLKDLDYEGRITGYTGLLEHLGGNVEEADRLYTKAVRIVRRAGRNVRAESIFLRHHADLRIALGDFDTAAALLQSASALADAGNFPDLSAYCRSTRGHLHRVRKQAKEAQLEYRTCFEEAARLGIRRLQSDVLSEMARLALDVGDAETARRRAIQSLMLANELSLGLRQTSALVVVGKAMLLAGSHDLGVAYLRHARDLAQEQSYFLRRREADELLRRHAEK